MAHVGLGEGFKNLFEPLNDRAVPLDEGRSVDLEDGPHRDNHAFAVSRTNSWEAGNGPALSTHDVQNAFRAAEIRGVEFVKKPSDDAGKICRAHLRSAGFGSV